MKFILLLIILLSILYMPGLSAQSDSDALGQPHHGHAGVTGSGHRTADGRTAGTEAVRTHQAAHLSHDDEEHRCSCSLPARCHPGAPFCRQVLTTLVYFSTSNHRFWRLIQLRHAYFDLLKANICMWLTKRFIMSNFGVGINRPSVVVSCSQKY